MMDRRSNNVTRRELFAVGGGCVAAAALTGLGVGKATAAPKLAQNVVGYQSTPKGNQRCDNCALFQAPDACQNVDGTIAPEGWCKIYRPKQS
jgi:hypothetical protein